jgi:hypothetical protein
VAASPFLGFCIRESASRKKKLSDATSILLIPLGKDLKSGYVVIIDFIMQLLSSFDFGRTILQKTQPGQLRSRYAGFRVVARAQMR